MIGNAGQHLAEVGFRIEFVQLRRSNQTVDGGRALTPASDPANK